MLKNIEIGDSDTNCALNNKGFTLIELLVVVAIIGVLATVGVLAFQGFMERAKINSTKSQHKTVVNYIQTEFQRCSLGEDYLTYKKWQSTGNEWNIIETSKVKINIDAAAILVLNPIINKIGIINSKIKDG